MAAAAKQHLSWMGTKAEKKMMVVAAKQRLNWMSTKAEKKMSFDRLVPKMNCFGPTDLRSMDCFPKAEMNYFDSRQQNYCLSFDKQEQRMSLMSPTVRCLSFLSMLVQLMSWIPPVHCLSSVAKEPPKNLMNPTVRCCLSFDKREQRMPMNCSQPIVRCLSFPSMLVPQKSSMIVTKAQQTRIATELMLMNCYYNPKLNCWMSWDRRREQMNCLRPTKSMRKTSVRPGQSRTKQSILLDRSKKMAKHRCMKEQLSSMNMTMVEHYSMIATKEH